MLLNLKIIDLQSEDLRILGKGEKIRLIPISKEITSYIKKMTQRCPFNFHKNEFIFIGKRGKKLKAEIIQKEISDNLFFACVIYIFVSTKELFIYPYKYPAPNELLIRFVHFMPNKGAAFKVV